MKKIYIIILIALISYLVPTTAKASSTSQEEIISSQTDALGISTFLSDSEKYTEETFGEIDINDIFTKSLSG